MSESSAGQNTVQEGRRDDSGERDSVAGAVASYASTEADETSPGDATGTGASDPGIQTSISARLLDTQLEPCRVDRRDFARLVVPEAVVPSPETSVRPSIGRAAQR
jgi:hypothetical protein